MRYLPLGAALAPSLSLCLGACAALGPDPTPAACAQSQNDLADAQGALTAAQLGLTAAQAFGAGADEAASDQAAVTAAQTLVTSVQARVSANCAAATPAS